MKREIKYRAWHPLNKEMVYPHTVGFNGLLSGDILNRFEDVMEFTNRYDSKGVEIYEGDVVMDNYGQNYIVCFDDNETPTFWLNGKQPKVEIEHYKLWRGSYERLTVIGNIYQNPELL